MGYKRLGYLLIFVGVAIATAVFSVAPNFATRIGISEDLASAYIALGVFVALATLLTGYLYKATERVKELEDKLTALGSSQGEAPVPQQLHIEIGTPVLFVGAAMILGDLLIRFTSVDVKTGFLTDFGVSVCAVGLLILLVGSWLERFKQDENLDSI